MNSENKTNTPLSSLSPAAARISQEIICNGYPQPSRAGEEITITAIMTAVALTFVLLRLFSRILIIGTLRWDDYLIVFTAVSL